MKTIVSLAVAGMIAATSLASTTVTADAGGKNWNGGKHWNGGKQYYPRHHNYRHNDGWNSGAALATGAILGLAIGSLATPNYYYAPPPPRVYYAPPPPPAYGYYGGPTAQHISWCESQYRSYDARYNTWVGYDGYVHQCVSPF
jgi:hypothetical protein